MEAQQQFEPRDEAPADVEAAKVRTPAPAEAAQEAEAQANAISIRNFTMVFDEMVAVRKLSMDIRKGDVFGFIGPNGAGKSTTMKFLATLLRPSMGEATVNGYSVTREPVAVRRTMGYMPDVFGVYDGMRVWEYLDFFGAAYQIAPARRKRVIDDVLVLLDLTEKRNAFVETLSRGMTQRLVLAKTLVHDPDVLILDEPASGLDPRARLEMKELLKELQRMGKTIFISSHILSELADLCNAVGIIERGRLLAAGEVQQIRRRIREHATIEVQVADREEETRDVLAEFPGVRDVEAYGPIFRIEYDGELSAIPRLHRALVERNIGVLWVREVEINLEDLFMRVTQGQVQ